MTFESFKDSKTFDLLVFVPVFLVIILLLPIAYSILLYRSEKLKRQGFYMCWKCWGSGKEDEYNICPKCKGKGKVDWVQRIVKGR